MDESIQQEPDGHYVTALPFKNTHRSMPSNRTQAISYAQGLKKRLLRNRDFHRMYTQCMEDTIQKGYAEMVPSEELVRTDGRMWYVPHHGVVNPNKPGKVRVVYNCPATFKGMSLNEQLLQGPDLTNGLCGVLLRWRKEPVAVNADIESMFYQVCVREEDRDMMRFLWWPNGDLDGDLVEYRMKVHMFGAVSSPSCANYVLRKIGENCVEESPEVAEAINNSFYVDDMLKAFPSEEEAIQTSLRIKDTLLAGGFNLTKWTSNSRRLIEAIDPEDRSKEIKKLDIDYDSLPVERALGVTWDVETDKLGFSSKDVDKSPTRRRILAVVASVYDPLGIVAPYVLKAKGILQNLCQKKIGWDEEIPQDQRNLWNQWLGDLPRIKEVQLDRCFKSAAVLPPQQVQLHHFADASEKGYGTVTYLRYVNRAQIHCSFVIAKSRVAPLKKVSIPRLELTAATMMIRINNMLMKELQMHIDDVYFWTDSQIVLRYIMNESSRFQTFVANRVEVIRDGSDVSQWNYVPTQINPADDCSRGLSLEKLLNSEAWFRGPKFLWNENDSWPRYPPIKPEALSSEDPEVKKAMQVSYMVDVDISNTSDDPVNMLITYYSSWIKLKRAVAWLLRLKSILNHRAKCGKASQPKQSRELTIDELAKAEVAILRVIQQQAFPNEMKACQDHVNENTKKPISKSSSILSLDPVLTDDGLLRVGGRLRNAPIDHQAKHPVILPTDCHVSNMIIRHTHETINHEGRNHVLGELRQRYWIINASAAVRKLVRSCVTCRKYQAKSGVQKMADLPTCRLQPNEPAFSQTGVDYFGPIPVKVGRTTKKRYGVLFTCFTSRAIHIEVAETLDTSSCINAIRRFISRRGPVKEMHSDNGTNFIGANNELKSALQEIDQETMQRFGTNHGFKWSFNVPAASHHGGVWERQIRTVKKILQAILTEQHIKVTTSDEQLYTLLCEVESTINSRPLTKASDDPTDLDVLTPNHLLHMKTPENLPPGTFVEKDLYARKRWRQIQFLADLFWKRWIKDYLPSLQSRQKWLQPDRNLKPGDIVLIVDQTAPRNSWPMGRVEQTYVGSQGQVRSASVKTKSATLTRPITKLCLILEAET